MTRPVPFKTWGLWFRFWAKVFGRPVPASADRAHIGNLLCVYFPPGTAPDMSGGQITDARRIHVIGDLWVFDYGETPFATHESRIKTHPPRTELGLDAALLADNIRRYGKP